MKVKKALLIALCGASLLATQPAYTFGFGAFISGVTAAWSVLPKRVMLISALCFGVWKLVNRCFSHEPCSICMDTQEEGEWVTCKEIYGDRGSDKHGFHRECVRAWEEHGGAHQCPLCKATCDVVAADAAHLRMGERVADRDIHETAAELQEEFDHAAPVATPVHHHAEIAGPLAHVIRPVAVPLAIWQKANNSLANSHGTMLDLSNTVLTADQFAELAQAIPEARRPRITRLDLLHNQLDRLSCLTLGQFAHLTGLKIQGNPNLASVSNLLRIFLPDLRQLTCDSRLELPTELPADFVVINE